MTISGATTIEVDNSIAEQYQQDERRQVCPAFVDDVTRFPNVRDTKARDTRSGVAASAQCRMPTPPRPR